MMTESTAALTKPEAHRLAECEAVIERGLATFVEVGQALLLIRDERLYRESHKTFEEYCRERWGWGRNYANKQIAAAEVVQNLGTFVPKPETEAQARVLASLTTDRQREVWSKALQNGQVTARDLTELIRAEAEAVETERQKPLTPAEREARAREKEELKAGSDWAVALMKFIEAIETLNQTPLVIADVAREFRKFDWEGKLVTQVRPAILKLENLCQELDI